MIGKWLLIFFPTFILLYALYCIMWNDDVDPYILLIVGFLTFLVNVYFMRNEYYAGIIEVEHLPNGGKRYSLNLEADPEDLDTKKKVIFYVESPRD
jgi:hypothetical protein